MRMYMYIYIYKCILFFFIVVALVPFEKNRFLASASVDKTYKFWDRLDTSGSQSCLKRGIVSNGAWMTNWPCAVLTFDDALG